MKKYYSCPYFDINTDVAKTLNVTNDIVIVLTKDNKLFVLAPHGFWGEVGSKELYKGKYSTRTYILDNDIVSKCKKAKEYINC